MFTYVILVVWVHLGVGRGRKEKESNKNEGRKKGNVQGLTNKFTYHWLDI